MKESSSEQSLYFLYIDAMSVVNAKHRRASAKDSLDEWAVQAPSNLQDFTSKDLEFVVRFAAENGVHMFRRLVHSMCPSIYGHEILKGTTEHALIGFPHPQCSERGVKKDFPILNLTGNAG